MTLPLVLAVHGSSHPDYRDVIEELARAAGPAVSLGWIDHEQPDLATAVAAARREQEPVVVLPLLLAAGFHARVDVPTMLAASHPVVVTRPLGPDPQLADALLRRLTETGLHPDDAIVIAAAGSTDSRAVADIEQVVSAVRTRRTAPVQSAYLSGGQGLTATIEPLIAAGSRVLVGTYLICPGKLADAVAEQSLAAGATGVSAPLGVCAELVQLIHDRWADAQSA